MWFAALTPSPREANAVQSVQRFTPLKRFASAWMIASRAVRTVKNEWMSAWGVAPPGRLWEGRAGQRTCRVAWLEEEGVEEEVEEDGVAAGRPDEHCEVSR